MLYHEIYGCYFKAVEKMISLAIKGELTEKQMKQICDTYTFSESFLEIIPSIKNQSWQLITSDLKTPIENIPSTPITGLQLRWLKSISLDRRIRLFDVDCSFLEDVEPLFTSDDFVIFDMNNDGDDYEDEEYISHFKTVLSAIKEKKRIWVKYLGNKGMHKALTCDPYELEFSEKDDKFRVHVTRCADASTLNISGIEKCKIAGEAKAYVKRNQNKPTSFFTVILTDERNALERFLHHFSHFEKEAEQIDTNTFKISVFFEKEDQTEMVIRILSFGSSVKVTEPKHFINLIKSRLIQQINCKE